MIRLAKTDNGRVIAVRVIAAHHDLTRGGLALSAVIPVRWIGSGVILSAIGWTAAWLAS